MSIRIIKPGMLSTIQDLGRWGYQSQGVIVGGAMDPFAHRIANALVGNEAHCATLEITLGGMILRFEENSLIALAGGGCTMMMEEQTVPAWKPIAVKAGTEWHFKTAATGCRAYLAIAGGWKVPTVLGSASTYLRAKLGGYQGRPLQANDVLEIDVPPHFSVAMLFKSLNFEESYLPAPWSIPQQWLSIYRPASEIRVIRGPAFDELTPAAQGAFFQEEFKLSQQADRMGYRLQGPAIAHKETTEWLSTAVTRGSIQVMPDGQLILLMADCQTIGGYPRIAQVAAIDLPRCAQLRPGDQLHFVEILFTTAEQLYLEREKQLQQLIAVLKEKLSAI